MPLPILLFILYSILGGYAILKLPFFRNSGIRPGVLLALFALHVAVGCLHNIISWRFYPHHGDIWFYYENSITMGQELRTDFHAFLADNGTWDRFTHNSLIAINIILNFFSRQNLYINTLLFSFPVFLGTTALFRVFRRHFPDSMLTALSVYLLPSALFWTSCIHREGALYMLLGSFFYALDQRKSATAIVLFFLIAYFRSAVALTLIPGLIAWWLLANKPSKRLILIGSAALAVLIALATPTILNVLAHQQHADQVLTGNSRIALPVLDGTLSSFLHTLPYALLNGWFEPLPGVGGQTIYTAFALELLLIWAIILLALIRRTRRTPRAIAAPPPAPMPNGPSLPVAPARDHFAACCIIFALSGMLLVGLIVPFVGAIVRYRSIYLPFLLAPALYQLRSLPFLRRFDQWTTHKL